MEPRARGANGSPHRGGGLHGRLSQVVHQYDHRPMLNAELAERTIELILHGDARGRIWNLWTVVGQELQVAAVMALATRLGVAGVHEKPIRPRLKALGIPEARQVAPRVEQRILGRVLCQGRVAEDPARNGVQAVTDTSDQGVERLFVAVHRQLDELPLHPSPFWLVESDRVDDLVDLLVELGCAACQQLTLDDDSLPIDVDDP